MDFVKGAVLGMIAGAIIGVTNYESLNFIANRGMKKLKKMRRRYMF